jgi:hypothetical protein
VNIEFEWRGRVVTERTWPMAPSVGHDVLFDRRRFRVTMVTWSSSGEGVRCKLRRVKANERGGRES